MMVEGFASHHPLKAMFKVNLACSKLPPVEGNFEHCDFSPVAANF